MNKAQKDVLKASLDDEKRTIRELKQVYNKAKEDVEERIRQLSSRTDMENLQSIIYQKKYQEALKKQLDDILDNLNKNQFNTIDEYLKVCYENGYIGTMYDLQSQGIPMTVPIDQKKVVNALKTDTKLSSTKYKEDPLKGRLEEDVDFLKLKVRAELSRSVANGSSWNEVAVKIAKGMNNPFDKAYKNALLIARTEGHRVQQSASLDACHVAKSKGADIVKQWDATLDGKTRSEHRKADGQIRELDEPFDVWGEKMDAPAIGGSARNVCNCRCQLLQRARWALDESELKVLQERAEFFGLDKTEEFEEYKKKYLEALNDPYASMTFLEKKELIHNNEQKINRLQQEKKQAEFEAIMASTPEEMETAFQKSKSIKKQIDDIAIENENITKALGLPTNAKERFLAQDIDLNILPHDVNDDEYDAFSSWCRTGYVDINRYMRQGDKGVRPQSIKDAKILQECLERNVVKEPLTVKRGISTNAMDKWFGDESWKKEGFKPNGAVIVDKGFCATSPAIRGGFGGDVVAYIDIPSGAKGAYIEGVSAAKEEKEFLLQCGTHFELKEVVVTYDKWNEPHYDVYMKVIVDE